MLKQIGLLLFILLSFTNTTSASIIPYQIESFGGFSSLEDPSNLLPVTSTEGITGWFTVETTTPATHSGANSSRFENPILDMSINFGGLTFSAESMTSSRINQIDVGGSWIHYSMQATYAPWEDFDSVSVSIQIDAEPFDHNLLGEDILAIDSSFYSLRGFKGGDSFVMEGQLVQASVVPIPAAVWLFGSGLIGLIGVAMRKKA